MGFARPCCVVIGVLILSGAEARAQAVAFQPIVGSFPNGVTMSTTPVVSHDRRYVRLGVNPQFTGLLGFDPFLVPAAVSGGGPGPGAGGGLVGVAGLNGPIAGAGQPASPPTAAGSRIAVDSGSPSDSFLVAREAFEGRVRAPAPAAGAMEPPRMARPRHGRATRHSASIRHGR